MNFGDEGDDCPFDMMGDNDVPAHQSNATKNPFNVAAPQQQQQQQQPPPPPPATIFAPLVPTSSQSPAAEVVVAVPPHVAPQSAPEQAPQTAAPSFSQTINSELQTPSVPASPNTVEPAPFHDAPHQPETSNVIEKPPVSEARVQHVIAEAPPLPAPTHQIEHQPATIDGASVNPFAESESADFTLSEDASLRDDAYSPSTFAPPQLQASAVSSPVVAAPPQHIPAPTQAPVVSHTSGQAAPAAAPVVPAIEKKSPSNPKVKTTPKVLEHNPFESFGADDNPFGSPEAPGAEESSGFFGSTSHQTINHGGGAFPDLGASNNQLQYELSPVYPTAPASSVVFQEPQYSLTQQQHQPAVVHQQYPPAVQQPIPPVFEQHSVHPQHVAPVQQQQQPQYVPQQQQQHVAHGAQQSQHPPALPPMPQFPVPQPLSTNSQLHHVTPSPHQSLSQSPLLPPLPTLPSFTTGLTASHHHVASSFSGHHGGIQRSGSSSSQHASAQAYSVAPHVVGHQRTDSLQSRDLNSSSTGLQPQNSSFDQHAQQPQHQYAHNTIPVPQPQSHSYQGSPLTTPTAPLQHRQVSPPQTPPQMPQQPPQQLQQQRLHGHDRQRSEGSLGPHNTSQPPPPYPGALHTTTRSDSAPVHGHASSAHQFHNAQPVAAAHPMMQRRAESQQFFESGSPYQTPLQPPQPQQTQTHPAAAHPTLQVAQQPAQWSHQQSVNNVTQPDPHYFQQQQQQQNQLLEQQQQNQARDAFQQAPAWQPPQQSVTQPQQHSHFVPHQQQRQQVEQQYQQTFEVNQTSSFASYQQQPAEQQQQHGFYGQQQQEYVSPVEAHLLARRRGFIGCVGLGGRVIHVSNMTGAKPQLVVRTLSQVLTSSDATDSGRSYASSMSGLPGCITASTTKLDVVLKTLQHLPNVSPVLLSILQTMCTKTMDWAKGGQQELVQVFQKAIAAKKEAANNSPQLSSSPFNPEAPAAWGHQEALDTIQTLLMAGDRQEAVRCAMHYKLHSHALLIAMMCDTKDVYQNVVQSIIKEQLDQRSPLAFAYCTFNELPAPEVSADDKTVMLTQWIEHVSMMLSNFTREAGETLLQLGDQLVENGQYDCGHVCYLVAQLSPASRPGPQAPPKATQVAEALRSRYLLLGGHYHRSKCRAALLQPHNIFLTEVLEYSRQRENEKFVRVQLIPFRVIMAELYAELGMKQHLESYIQHLGKLLPSCQPRKDDVATRTVAEVVDALRKRTAAFYASNSSSAAQKGSGWWPTSLFSGSTTTAPSGTATDRQGSAAPPRTPLLQQTAPSNISRASSANPVPVSRPGGSSPPPAMQQQPQQTQQQPPVASQTPAKKQQEEEPDASKPLTAKKSGWGLGSLFRRSGSRPQQAADTPAKTEEESKPMIIDTEAPPTFDPVTGRWLFAKSKEEQAVDDQIKAGPPKMAMAPMMAAPQQYQQPQQQPSYGGAPLPGGMMMPPTGPPPPPGGMGGSGVVQRKYVDMFNS